jgi:hypothetical protein
MAELERELRALGAAIALPPELDLTGAVREGVGRPAPRRLHWRPIAVALALLALALGAAFAVPQARSAILRFFGLENVSVVRVDTLPPAAQGPGAVGRRISLGYAQRVLGFRPLLPDLGHPEAVYLDPGGEMLVLLYGTPVRLRLSELSGAFPIEKLVTREQRVERLRVNGAPGIWIEGSHVVELFGQPRVAGSTLLWQAGRLTLRLEGHLTKEQALRIASSIR